MKKTVSIQTRRPVAEFRTTPPVVCLFEVNGVAREVPLKLTYHSFNVIQQSGHAELITDLVSGKFQPDSNSALNPLDALSAIAVCLHAGMAHLPASEQMTLDEVTSAMPFESSEYYNEVFGLLWKTARETADPTRAALAAKAKPKAAAESSISTGPEPSLDSASSLDSAQMNLPN